MGLTVLLMAASAGHVADGAGGLGAPPLDSIPPVLTIVAPAAGAVLDDTTPSFDVTLTDPSGSLWVSGVKRTTFRAFINNVERTTLFTVTNTRATATLPAHLALADGSYTLRVEVKDNAGNLGSSQRTFSVLTYVAPPTLTLTTPAAGALLRASPATVTGTVVAYASGGATVTCQGVGTPVNGVVTGTNFSCAVPLAEGGNTAQVIARDTRSNTTSLSRPLSLDSTPPALTIGSPTPNIYTAAQTIAVSGTVADASPVTVTVNGIAATVTSGTFSVDAVPLGDDPLKELRAVADDQAGNHTETAISVHVVRSPLTLTLSAPAEGAALRTTTIDVAGAVSEGVPVDVTVDGTAVSVQNGSFTAQVTRADGPATIVASATDAAGRTTSFSRAFIVDTIAPTLTLAAPIASATTNDPTPDVRIDVAEAGSGIDQITLSIDGTPLAHTQQPVAGGASIAATLATPLADGPHDIALNVTDRAGNTRTLSASFTVQSVGRITGRVLDSSGAPVAGKTVRLLRQDTPVTVVDEQTSAGDGTFEFADVLLGAYSVVALNASLVVRGRVDGLTLATRDQVLTADVSMIGDSRLTVQVNAPAGETLPAALTVSIQSFHAQYGGVYAAVPDGGGLYHADVPEGRIEIAATGGGWRGAAHGVLRPFQPAHFEIDAVPATSVSFPVPLTDGNLFPFAIGADGSSGTMLALQVTVDGVTANFVGGSESFAEEAGREIGVRQRNLLGLDVTRKVYVPRAGYFARYLEALTNTTDHPVTVDVRVASALPGEGAGAADLIRTSSGDAQIDVSDPATADRWLVIDDAIDRDTTVVASMPALGFVLDAPEAPRRVDAATFVDVAGTRRLAYEWRQTVIEPGETVAFIHFGVQQVSRASAEASVRRLEQFPFEARALGLQPQELALVKNFIEGDPVDPLPALTGAVSGRVLGSDGVTPVANAAVTFRSLHPLFGRVRTLTANSAGAFTLQGSVDSTPVRLVPVGPYELRATHPTTLIVSPGVSADFPAGSSQSSADVVFAETTVVRGRVLKPGLGPVADAWVRVYAQVQRDSGTTDFLLELRSDSTGAYAVSGLPRGSYLISSGRTSQGISFGTSLTLVVSGEPEIVRDIVFTDTGSLTGLITNANGTPGAFYTLRATKVDKPSDYYEKSADATGRYLFPELEAGSYRLSGIGAATFIVSVIAGQQTTQDIASPGTGSFSVQVTDPGGAAAANAQVVLVRPDGMLTTAVATNASGQVTIASLTTGVYGVRAYRSGQPVLYSTVSATVLHQQTVSVTIALAPVATVSGRILTALGTNASFMTVAMRRGAGTSTDSMTTSTASDGTYTLSAVLADEPITVGVFNYAGGPAQQTLTVPAGTPATVNITLPAFATVQVRVQRPNGTRIPSRAVTLQSAGGNVRTGSTDANGQALFSFVPEGAFTVRHVVGTAVVTSAVAPAQHNTTILVPLVESDTATIEGFVTPGDGVTKVKDATLQVLDAADRRVLLLPAVDANAFYRAELPVGRPLILVATRNLNYPPYTAVGEQPLTIPAGAGTQTVSVSLPLGVVKGRISLNDGVTPASMPSVFISQVDAAGFTRTFDVLSTPGLPDYVIIGPYPGRFTVTAQSGPVVGTQDGVVASLATSVVVDVVLPPSGSVTGTLLDVTGAPLRNASVRLKSTQSPNNTPAATTDVNGRFVFPTIPLGDFTVQWVNGSWMASRMATLDTPGATLDLELKAPVTNTLSGRAFAANGTTPLSNQRVTARAWIHHGPMGQISAQVNTDSAGNFNLPPVFPKGTVFVSATTSGTPATGLTEIAFDPFGLRTANVRIGNATELNIIVDPHEFAFDIDCFGELRRGGTGRYAGISQTFEQEEWFEYASRLTLYGTRFPCVPGVSQYAKRGLRQGPFAFGDLRVTRESYVPIPGGFVRHLESFENPTSAPITVDVRLGSRYEYVLTPPLVSVWPESTANTFLVAGSAAFVVAGPQAAEPPASVTIADRRLVVDAAYRLTVLPGQTVSLLHYVVQARDPRAARERAEALVSLTDPDALSGLTERQRASIVNFVIP